MVMIAGICFRSGSLDINKVAGRVYCYGVVDRRGRGYHVNLFELIQSMDHHPQDLHTIHESI